MERHDNESHSAQPLRLSVQDSTTDDKYELTLTEELLERVIRCRTFMDIFPMFVIVLVLMVATGIMIALHMASGVAGVALESTAGGMDIPWWNGHLAMVVSLCISTLLGGLTVYLKMKKIDVILSTLLRRNGTRGDVFLDLMDGWVTNIRAVLTFDSPVFAYLQPKAMWQKPQNLTVTDLRPLTMTAIGQLQFSTAISNLDRLFFLGQQFPTNFVSPSNDIAAANKFDNASLVAFKATPRCQVLQTNFVTNIMYNGVNYVDLNITSLQGNLVAPGMTPGQITNGLITGVNLYWKQYFLKKAYNYGTYPNGTLDYVDEIVALVRNTAASDGRTPFNQVQAWNCRLIIESFEVAIDTATRSSGSVYSLPPKIIRRWSNPSGSIYGPGGEGFIHSNVTAGQFIGMAVFMNSGVSSTRAIGDQKYLGNFHTSEIKTDLTADDISLHLGDIALTLQLLTISGPRTNITVLRNGGTAYTAINIQGAASLLAVAWVLSFLLMIGIWSSQRLRWPAYGSSTALLSIAATNSFAEAVQPHSMGEWSAMRKRLGQSRWRLGRIYRSGEKYQRYGLSTSSFSQ